MESKTLQFVEADHYYQYKWPDSYYSIVYPTDITLNYNKNKLYDNATCFLAISPQIYFPNKTLWRLYPMQKKKIGFDKEWNIGSLRCVSKKLKGEFKVCDFKTLCPELLSSARRFVDGIMSVEWQKKYPLDKYFEIVTFDKEWYYVYKDACKDSTTYLFYKIRQAQKFNEDIGEVIKTSEWEIFAPYYTPLDICFEKKTLKSCCIKRKIQLPETKLQLCRDATIMVLKKRWFKNYPDDSKFQICKSKKSLFDVINNAHKLTTIKTKEGFIVDQTILSKEFLKQYFMAYVPKKIYVEKLKETFATFVAFPPNANQTKWKLFPVEKGLMNTSNFTEVNNLKNFEVKKKWDTNFETLSIARHFLTLL